MTREFLLAQLAAHFLADFVCQSDAMVKAKRARGSARFLGFLRHGLVHLFWSAVLPPGRWTNPVLLAAAAVVLAHLAIDLVRSGLERRHGSPRNAFWFFLLDQTLHLAFILAAAWSLGLALAEPPIDPSCLRSFKAFAGDLAKMPERTKVLSALVVTLAGTWGVGVGIRLYFQGRLRGEEGGAPAGCVPCGPADGTGAREGGFAIGLLERLIIMLSLLLRQEALIGFLLAVKSIARFKKFDSDCFIEYFIIGSSLSFLAAIIAGWLLRGLLLAQWM